MRQTTSRNEWTWSDANFPFIAQHWLEFCDKFSLLSVNLPHNKLFLYHSIPLSLAEFNFHLSCKVLEEPLLLFYTQALAGAEVCI